MTTTTRTVTASTTLTEPLRPAPSWRFLTLHAPAGFERFTLELATPAVSTDVPPIVDLPPDSAALASAARSRGIEILGSALLP